MWIKDPFPEGEVSVGDSVAVNGVCLTVEGRERGQLRFWASPTTLSDTTVSRWRVGEVVNLEPAMRVGDRVGGHIMSGHVSAVGRIGAIRRRAGEYRLKIGVVKGKIGVEAKGSVGVDGISLTVQDVDKVKRWFEVVIVPHTWENTNLKSKRVGALVNLEG